VTLDRSLRIMMPGRLIVAFKTLDMPVVAGVLGGGEVLSDTGMRTDEETGDLRRHARILSPRLGMCWILESDLDRATSRVE
jgi:hypothetical protein